MRLYSWNVNGIRAAVKKGLLDWLQTTGPDVLCLQETKGSPGDLTEDVLNPDPYRSYWAISQRKGYSGVATYSRLPVNRWSEGLGIERFDTEGRVVITDLGDFDLYNIYFPNGGQGPERVAFKLEFYEAFLNQVDEKVRSGRQVIVCGDVNTAHREIDLARPKENQKTSGFLPEERAWIDRFVEHGWVDTFRQFHPDATDAYTWWDQRFNARSRNIGWRIDYFLIHESFKNRVKDAGIMPEVTGSDHCPIWLDIMD
ncbi:MAG: exodeoxyribonuclease III [Chloroflexota bacterium]